MAGRGELLHEFWLFLRHHKKWWLIPILLVLLLLGVFIVATESPLLAPLMYTLF
jgi:hypothetical protein